jgi:aryl-alcohol dehydrogenase-like predicted oxidoreductase
MLLDIIAPRNDVAQHDYEVLMRYKLFGRGTGLRVSELVLGCGLFGTRWGYGADPDEARRMFNMYVEAGGNFIDTADTYQVGQSEELLGDFLGSQRDDLVVATKFTQGVSSDAGLLAVGNSRKAMLRSVEASLRRLKTDRIDLLWVHMADGVTSSEELMRALDDLVRSGKVLYVGLSDFPAWRVAHAATVAQLRGWAPLIGLQIEYSLVERTPDRELLPMAEAFGLGTVGWSPLGGGLLTGKYRRGETGRATNFARLIHSESDAIKTAAVDAVLAVADEVGVTPSVVALAWASARGVIPIVGPRTADQLRDNLLAADFDLSPEHVARLSVATAIPLGFPHELLAEDAQRSRLSGGMPDRIQKNSVPVA